MTDRPPIPAIVFGGEVTGLAVLRALGRAGVTVLVPEPAHPLVRVSERVPAGAGGVALVSTAPRRTTRGERRRRARGLAWRAPL